MALTDVKHSLAYQQRILVMVNNTEEENKNDRSAPVKVNLARCFAAHLETHKQLAQQYEFIPVPNQNADVLIMNPILGIKMVFKFEIGQNLHHALVTKKLWKSIEETYLMIEAHSRYLLLVGVTDLHDLNWTISIMDKRYFPQMRLKSYADMINPIEFVLECARNPPIILSTIEAPIDYREDRKSLLLSVSQVCDGITPGLVKRIFEYPGYGIRGYDDLIKTDPQLLQNMLEEIFYDYYGGREQKALVTKFVTALHQQY